MMQASAMDYMCRCGNGASNLSPEALKWWISRHSGEGHGPVDYYRWLFGFCNATSVSGHNVYSRHWEANAIARCAEEIAMLNEPLTRG